MSKMSYLAKYMTPIDHDYFDLYDEGDKFTREERTEIEALRDSLSEDGMLNDDGEYYLSDDVYVSVETLYLMRQ